MSDSTAAAAKSRQHPLLRAERQPGARRRRAGASAALAKLALSFAAGLAVAVWGGPALAADPVWHDAGSTRGVALQWTPAEPGHRAYRGTVSVCTDLAGLRAFVADAARLHRWIPYTEEARALPAEGDQQRYYLLTSAPWPFRSRDLVYRLVPRPRTDADTVYIVVTGEPRALPERPDAVRMRAAEGLWTLRARDGRVQVSLRLAVDPGRVPRFFAHRRLAATVGGMLANLAAQFPCG